MKRLLCLLFLIVPVIALQAQIQTVTSAQKQEALNTVTTFCNLLSRWCEGQRTLDKDIYSMCTGRDISAFDDVKMQKETSMQNYMLAIQKNYSKSLKMTISQPSLSNAKIYYKPEISFTERIGSYEQNQHNPFSQGFVTEATADYYTNAYIVFPVSHSVGNEMTSERNIIYDVMAGKISAYVKGDGTYTSFLKGLECMINKDYVKGIPYFKTAMSNNRASLKYDSSVFGLMCCMASQEFEAGDPFLSYLKTPLFDNLFKGFSLFKHEQYREALPYFLKCEEILNSTEVAEGFAETIYTVLFIFHSLPEEDGGLYDIPKAVKYARLAIKEKSLFVAYDLYLFYENYDLFPKYIDREEVLRYLKWAAEHGHTGAILLEGIFSEEQNKISEATQWFEKGAMAGEAICMARLGRLLVNSNATRTTGVTWLNKSLGSGQLETQIANYDGVGLVGDSFWPQNRYQVENLVRQYSSQNNHVSSSASTNTSTLTSPNNTYNSTNSNSAYSTPSTYSAPSSYSYTKHHYSSFNDAKDDYTAGISFAYVQKQWEYKGDDGSVEKYGVFSDDGESKYVQGVQMGIRYEPQFGHGFGLNTGLFCEYYWYESDKYDGIYGKWNEVSAYMPLDLEFRMNFSENFQLFMYGGISMDCGIYANMSFYDSYYDDELIEEDDNVYSDEENEMHRFNLSYEYGGGFRCKNVQLQFHLSKGLLDMAVNGADYTVKQNKPMTISLSFMF